MVRLVVSPDSLLVLLGGILSAGQVFITAAVTNLGKAFLNKLLGNIDSRFWILSKQQFSIIPAISLK